MGVLYSFFYFIFIYKNKIESQNWLQNTTINVFKQFKIEKKILPSIGYINNMFHFIIKTKIVNKFYYYLLNIHSRIVDTYNNIINEKS